jgi:hypothetical protein
VKGKGVVGEGGQGFLLMAKVWSGERNPCPYEVYGLPSSSPALFAVIVTYSAIGLRKRLAVMDEAATMSVNSPSHDDSKPYTRL